jgi:DNA-binding NarL/FixJ family response regulator
MTHSIKKYRILIIEDNRVLCGGIQTMINGEADMRVVATLKNGSTVLPLARQKKPHIILLDGSLKNTKEPSVIKSVRKNLPNIKVIGMGFVPSQTDIVEFVEAGASGFILKEATVKEFLGTIRIVAQGGKVIPPLLTDSLFSSVIEHALKKGEGKYISTPSMTKREREIMVLIADGLSNKEIADRLNIAWLTVKSHVHNILEKLALHNRLQIAMRAQEEKKN